MTARGHVTVDVRPKTPRDARNEARTRALAEAAKTTFTRPLERAMHAFKCPLSRFQVFHWLEPLTLVGTGTKNIPRNAQLRTTWKKERGGGFRKIWRRSRNDPRMQKWNINEKVPPGIESRYRSLVPEECCSAKIHFPEDVAGVSWKIHNPEFLWEMRKKRSGKRWPFASRVFATWVLQNQGGRRF